MRLLDTLKQEPRPGLTRWPLAQLAIWRGRWRSSEIPWGIRDERAGRGAEAREEHEWLRERPQCTHVFPHFPLPASCDKGGDPGSEPRLFAIGLCAPVSPPYAHSRHRPVSSLHPYGCCCLHTCASCVLRGPLCAALPLPVTLKGSDPPFTSWLSPPLPLALPTPLCP